MTALEKSLIDRRQIQLEESKTPPEELLQEIAANLREGEGLGKPFRVGRRIVIPIESN